MHSGSAGASGQNKTGPFRSMPNKAILMPNPKGFSPTEFLAQRLRPRRFLPVVGLVGAATAGLKILCVRPLKTRFLC